jgi:hypothetical protein
MTVQEKRSLIDQFLHAMDPLEEAVKKLPPEAVDFVPAIPGAWTIRAQVAHLLDADMFAWGRIRKSVAQPEAPVDVWDQEGWAARLDYGRVDLGAAFEQIRLLRRSLCEFLVSIVDKDWTQFAMNHPERGRRTLEETVKTYVDHVDFHLKLIQRNAAAYEEQLGE